jgi:hypothetical protein
LGLILFAGKSDEHVELLQLKRSGIRVAEYLTELPPRQVSERRLHEAIRTAREWFEPTLQGTRSRNDQSGAILGMIFRCSIFRTFGTKESRYKDGTR